MIESPRQQLAERPAPGLARVRAESKFFFEGERKVFLKGATYGPFRPDRDGHHLPSPERVREDLQLMRKAGINLLRLYHVPPRWFLDSCEAEGMRVLVSLPWAEHIEFLNDRALRRQIVETIEKGVGTLRGHSAVLGFLVGNEIPSAIVRWLGVNRVIAFVEELIEAARKVNPEALYSYASYPPTEYLIPKNADFLTFNVYLHRQEDFERYLARLQNLAGDRPLVMGEFGMDTIRHTEDEQAEMLRWHIESVVRGGLAGTILFSWTDEWFTGGVEIDDWAFGLVTRDRKPKKAFHEVAKLFAGDDPPYLRVPLASYPKVSVIVCSYNGSRTVEDCLTALRKLNYPDFEVVFVDDGSTDDTPEIVRRFPEIVAIRQDNMGLSYARNVGAHAAKGGVLAYTDSDCMPDPDWLYFMVGALLSGDYAGVGGPNLPPPAEGVIQACVTASPGGPSHVLTTDVVAEHVPGCNMAFHRWAFDKVGGFDSRYRKAGDDVDFCWRLQQEGGVIAFSPAAIVWHYRRFTLKAYINQQKGYGEAESMLRFKHLIFFGPTGNAKWKGRVYGPDMISLLPSRMLVYHGIFGSGLFQTIYPAPQSELAAYLRSIEWVFLTVCIFVLSIPLDPLRLIPYLMFGGTFLVSLRYMTDAPIEPRYDTVGARLLVAALALVQPLFRGWARYHTWLRVKRTASKVISRQEAPFKRVAFKRGLSSLAFWSENSIGREQLLPEVFSTLDQEGWSYSVDTGWKNWDIQIYGNFWWIIKIRTLTEYHGGPKFLTRVRLGYQPIFTTVLVHLVLAAILLYRQLFTSVDDLWLLVAYGVFAAWTASRAVRLKRRVRTLIESAASRCGLGATKPPEPGAQKG